MRVAYRCSMPCSSCAWRKKVATIVPLSIVVTQYAGGLVRHRKEAESGRIAAATTVRRVAGTVAVQDPRVGGR